MDLNIIRLSLGSIILGLLISCSNEKPGHNDKAQVQVKKVDSCVLDLGEAQNIDFKVGCGNCHSATEKRQFPQVLTYGELSAMDSLTLKDFIFKTKHKGFFLTDTLITHYGNAIDSLDECQKKNLIHYLKDFNRHIPERLKVPKNVSGKP